MECCACPCKSLNPTRRNDLLYCETCFLQTFPEEPFTVESSFLEIRDDYTVFLDQEWPDSLEEELLDFSFVRCQRCNSIEFFLNFTCACQRSVICEECFPFMSRTNCKVCKTTPQRLYDSSYQYFKSQMEVTCEYCQTKVRLANLKTHHRLSCSGAIGRNNLRFERLKKLKKQQILLTRTLEETAADIDVSAEDSSAPFVPTI